MCVDSAQNNTFTTNGELGQFSEFCAANLSFWGLSGMSSSGSGSEKGSVYTDSGSVSSASQNPEAGGALEHAIRRRGCVFTLIPSPLFTTHLLWPFSLLCFIFIFSSFFFDSLCSVAAGSDSDGDYDFRSFFDPNAAKTRNGARGDVGLVGLSLGDDERR